MHYIPLIEAACWIVFIVVWLTTAFTAKRTLNGPYWFLNPWIRIVFFIILYVLFHNQFNAWFAASVITINPLVGVAGVALTIIGVGLAVWARFFLGANWGMPMSLKENRELVTAGPYRYVRHPIYSGMLLAMLGSALAIGSWWFIVLVISFFYFLFSATTEERMLEGEFSEAYPAYKKRTKMLIPFVV